MQRIPIGTVVLAMAAAGACERQGAAPPPPPPLAQDAVARSSPDADYPVTLLFDGGYAFIRDDKEQSLTVAAFDGDKEVHHAGGVPSAMAHDLRLRLDLGKVVAAPDALTITQPLPVTWSLDEDRYDVAFPSYGETAAGVVEPSSSTVSATDPCSRAGKNNLRLMPNMNTLAKAGQFDDRVITDRGTYRNRVLLTSGTMSIASLTSCLEFRQAGAPVARHRVPSGLGGIHVDFKMKGNLKLTLTDPQGKVQIMEFAPARDALGREALQLWFGRFPPPCAANEAGCVFTKGQEIADFARFYALLQKPPVQSKKVMPRNASDRDEVCPGSQCPGIYIRRDR